MAQSPFPIAQFVYANTLPVADGFVVVQLSKDCKSSGGQVASRIKVRLLLNSSGNIINDPLFYPNSELQPNDSVYIYSVYNSDGHRVLGPVTILIGESTGTGFGLAFGSSFGS